MCCAVALVLLGSLCAGAQTTSPLLHADDLKADAAILRRAYEQMHPGLYRYRTKPEMDAEFARLERALDHDQTLQQAYLAFSQFAATVRCGHTYANFFNQPKSVAQTLFQGHDRVPFYFVWLDGEMVVTRDFSAGHDFPAGTRILSINGHASHHILRTLLTIARSDGSNDAKRIASLNVTGDSVYETFDVYFPMFFPQTSETLTIRERLPHAPHDRIVKAKTLSYADRIAPIRQREAERKGGDGPQFTWSYLPNGAAYLKMPTWALFDSKWQWKPWLKDHMEEAIARNARALVVDLRGNEGGQDVGNELLPYFITADLHLASMRRLVRYRKAPEDLLPYLDTWDKSFRDWGASAVDLPQPWPTAPSGVIYLKQTKYDDDAEGDVIHPAASHFAGKVYVLVDATNSSATFQFDQVVQQNHLATLVGEATGGSQRGINGGAFFFLRLPHSKIELDLPLIGTFPQEPMPDSGLTPEVLARPNSADIAAGRDVVLLRVDELVAKTAQPTPALQ